MYKGGSVTPQKVFITPTSQSLGGGLKKNWGVYRTPLIHVCKAPLFQAAGAKKPATYKKSYFEHLNKRGFIKKEMGRGRRGVLNQSQKKGHHYCKREREDDKILLLSVKTELKKSGIEISEGFLAQLRKMDQGQLANELLSSSSIK